MPSSNEPLMRLQGVAKTFGNTVVALRGVDLEIERGKVRLSDRFIFGLLAVAVFSPANHDQSIKELDGYFLTFGKSAKLMINEWWGRASDFPAIAAQEPMPQAKLDFGNWSQP